MDTTILIMIILVLSSLVALLVRAIYITIASRIDWYEELTKPAHLIDWVYLERKAFHWRTCAIAVYYKGWKNKYNVPEDQPELIKLGIEFHHQVRLKRANRAIKVLNKIVSYKPVIYQKF